MPSLYYWLFPLIFMIHDFEEILFVKAWIRRNRAFLQQKVPGLANRLLPHFDRISTPGFALAVAEEFVLISLVTVFSSLTHQFFLWYALFLAFSLHLLMHLGQGIVLKRYVPGLVTSLLLLPICGFVLGKLFTSGILTMTTVGYYLGAGLFLLLINLWLIHRAGAWFSDWLRRYERGISVDVTPNSSTPPLD